MAPASEFRTGEFLGFYDDVTARLQHFCGKALTNGLCTQREVEWFVWLMDNFKAKYEAWPDNEDTRDYLEMFAGCGDYLRLAGHAFLHISYDLPRVIADSFVHFGVPRRRMRMLFLRPSPLFRQTLMDRAKAGHLGGIARLVGKIKPAEMLGYWTTYLRSVAWIHAEMLDSVDDVTRAKLDVDLAKAMKDAATVATEARWFDLLNIPRLDNYDVLFKSNPRYFAALPIALPDTRLAFGGIVGLTVAGVAFERFRNGYLADRIRALGACVSLETSKAVGGRPGVNP